MAASWTEQKFGDLGSEAVEARHKGHVHMLKTTLNLQSTGKTGSA